MSRRPTDGVLLTYLVVASDVAASRDFYTDDDESG
jgi:hypothetical protein